VTPAELIAKKRDGHALSRDEIAFVIRGFVDGSIPEYQMSALAMAIFFQGMEDEETAALTQEMLLSGVRLEWPAGSPVVDKHSTGGVGDKVSLVLAPLLASCGLRVPMISGRGLGPTGGTLDKLEAIPGFRTDLSISEMQDIVERVGCVITGATENLVPADRKLYSLRDVTATVPSIPLITASIMSKKLAESLNALVLDVKCGSGAFMKTRDQAVELAESLVRAGQRMGVRTTALVTDMNQPLGRMCGNANEVAETLECLAGGGPDDLRYVTLALGSELLVSAERCQNQAEAENLLIDRLDSGAAREVFEQMVVAQGGDLKNLCQVASEQAVLAERSGFITKMDTEALGMAVIDLGGGRRRMGDAVNHSVGIEMLVKIGDEIASGEPIANVFAERKVSAIVSRVSGAITIGDSPGEWPEFIVERVR
jgi:pyrimidine-nucleoside phosphorylase